MTARACSRRWTFAERREHRHYGVVEDQLAKNWYTAEVGDEGLRSSRRCNLEASLTPIASRRCRLDR
jgi:hypothetical protein